MECIRELFPFSCSNFNFTYMYWLFSGFQMPFDINTCQKGSQHLPANRGKQIIS